jgi:hypothetical protein
VNEPGNDLKRSRLYRFKTTGYGTDQEEFEGDSKMQSISTINQQRITEHAVRTSALNDAAKRLLQRVLGCWHHDLSRPFSLQGKSYRVCMKCGMARNFDPVDWKTSGPTFQFSANNLYNDKMRSEIAV